MKGIFGRQKLCVSPVSSRIAIQRKRRHSSSLPLEGEGGPPKVGDEVDRSFLRKSKGPFERKKFYIPPVLSRIAIKRKRWHSSSLPLEGEGGPPKVGDEVDLSLLRKSKGPFERKKFYIPPVSSRIEIKRKGWNIIKPSPGRGRGTTVGGG